MKKILLCLFACLLVIAPVCTAAVDDSEGKAKIYVMREILSYKPNKYCGLTVYINGALISDLLPNNFIYFETEPKESVVAFSDGSYYLDYVIDASPNQSYYLKVESGVSLFTKGGSSHKYVKKLTLMDKSEGEEYLKRIKEITPNPMNKLTKVH